MTDPDLIRLFIEPLEQLNLSYMVTGGVASVIYGDPRFTRDVDVVLELPQLDAEILAAEFIRRDMYVPPIETLRAEIGKGEGHFNLIDRETGLRADVYLAGTDRLHAWAFSRRQRLDLDRIAIWVAPVEYVILRKLQYFVASDSDRHLRDVAMMLRISGDAIDANELARWIDKLGLTAALERAKDYG